MDIKVSQREMNLQVTEKLHEIIAVSETCFNCIQNRLVSNPPRELAGLCMFFERLQVPKKKCRISVT